MSGIRLTETTHEILRVTTPYKLRIGDAYRILVRDVYCLPPAGATPPIYAPGEINILNQATGLPVFRADVGAMMDTYWRLANEIILDPVEKAEKLKKVLDTISGLHGSAAAEDVARALRTSYPGQDVDLCCGEDGAPGYDIIRTVGEPATLQVSLLVARHAARFEFEPPL